MAYSFAQLREKYSKFIYYGFDVEYASGIYTIIYHFEIEGLDSFNSKWKFEAEECTDSELFEALLFNLGLVEAISYWKIACPKNLEIRCGQLEEEEILWWRKLFYKGLGEFQYINGINLDEEDFINIETKGKKRCGFHSERKFEGCLVPVGGGKDSVVSLELLKGEKIMTYCVNGNETTTNVINACTHNEGEYTAKRILDKKILEYNEKGYLNGHIPFSAVLAFSSYITAFLLGKKYIALSNECSANESTVKDSFVNHQYSKSFEFEMDFANYMAGISDLDIHYFSLLRPLQEIQIAKRFSQFDGYHSVFRSCNKGSKKGIWCCDCSKCLFVYIILSPFLSQKRLEKIFGEKLLEKEAMDVYFRELTGIDENKPFECVGTRQEVRVALKAFVQMGGKSLLTERYKDFILSEPNTLESVLNEYSDEHNVPKQFIQLVIND